VEAVSRDVRDGMCEGELWFNCSSESEKREEGVGGNFILKLGLFSIYAMDRFLVANESLTRLL
jgi:hypothetical protein